MCPAGHPYLIHQYMAPGRILPDGVSVQESGGVGVSGDSQTATFEPPCDEMGIGVAGLSTTNWDPLHHAEVIGTLHCSNNYLDDYKS